MGAVFGKGDIIEVCRFPLNENVTSIELQFFTQLKLLRLFKRIIGMFEDGGLEVHKQVAEGRYYSNKLLQSYKEITGQENDQDLERKVRGLFYPPYDGAYTIIHGKKIYIN